MGKSESSKNNNNSLNQVRSNTENVLNLNAPGGVSIQVLGMDIKMSDLNITIGPNASISDIQSVLDQISRRE
ncbi:hypothetical protein E1I69_12790 [Bacillus timonensis]|uniref:Uncharacterized protein n=1 Tax=Bacillus timonensis TaxID=1033734 RepID=A0A4S3PRW8_9BACI|nr:MULTISPECIES: hypothetical protein [Bacillus]MCC3355656.1 hypothetical protein [Bacillus sp. REN16]THE12035.1 hypothetical protein E1I69_12790 [Bacillus timonensis]